MSPARIARDDYLHTFDQHHEPVLRMKPGDSVIVETYDCYTNKIDSAEQVFASEADLLTLIGSYNPVNRPIYVEGARPGDYLAVRIDDIALGTHAPYAVTTLTRDSTGICGSRIPIEGAVPDTRICLLEDGRVTFPTRRGALTLPTRPMVGTIGTAPAARSWVSLHSDPGHGGNMDCPSVTVGATVVLPVNVEGGLLSLGDVHAAMGDAEITGTALETNADVRITVELIPRADRPAMDLPWLETAETLGTIGCAFGVPVETNIAHAFRSLHGMLTESHDLDSVEALELLGAVARVEVNQCVGGSFSAVHVSLARTILRDLTNRGGTDAASRA
jgi:amidase